MNKVILTGTLVAHLGDHVTEGGCEVHQATISTFEPYLQGNGHTEMHTLVFFGQDALAARELPLGTRVLIQAAIRWAPVPCLHAHSLEVL